MNPNTTVIVTQQFPNFPLWLTHHLEDALFPYNTEIDISIYGWDGGLQIKTEHVIFSFLWMEYSTEWSSQKMNMLSA